MKAALVLGTQLFEHNPACADAEVILFVESERAFCRRPYHAHKIVLLLSAMRHAADRLERSGRRVARIELGQGLGFADGLRTLLREHHVQTLAWMSATDRGIDSRIARLCEAEGVLTEIHPDGLFLTPTEDLDRWFAAHPAARMEDFYRWQRRRTGILMDGDSPVGGRWNFDADNRQPLPRGGLAIPPLPFPDPDAITRAVIAEVADRFPGHPGDPADFWLPVTPDGARAWLADFVTHRLASFGPYEDAMAADKPFLFHAVLSPLLNIGLLRVEEVVEAAVAPRPSRCPLGLARRASSAGDRLAGVHAGRVPRQPHAVDANHFGLTRRLEPWWYTGRDISTTCPGPHRAGARAPVGVSPTTSSG